MASIETFGDVSLAVGDDQVATVEMHRPPDNYFDVTLIAALAEAYDTAAASGAHAIVLCSEGKHFCAGADFSGRTAAAAGGSDPDPASDLYAQAARLFRNALPVVAAVQGAAVGGGLGLACSADFRVVLPEARFVANFARLGFHHGFALSVSLPWIIGEQRTMELLYTGRRVKGDEAFDIGLCDAFVEQDDVRHRAHEMAHEIAGSAPLAVQSIRVTARAGLLQGLDAALEREGTEQERLRKTQDFAEGIRAMAERRGPRFEGR